MMYTRIPLRFIGLTFLIAVVFASGCRSQNASQPASAQAVIEKFLQLDSDAAGLSKETWPEFAQYTTYTEAPSWDTFIVIDRYELGPVTVGSTRATAQVTYYPLGKLTNTFTPDTHPEVVTYHLNLVGDQWKVDSTQLIPHIAWDVMKRRLEAASAADAKVKATNDALIAQISAVKH